MKKYLVKYLGTPVPYGHLLYYQLIDEAKEDPTTLQSSLYGEPPEIELTEIPQKS